MFTDYTFGVAITVDREDEDFEVLSLMIQDPCENEKVVKERISESGNYEDFISKCKDVLEKEIRKILYLKDNF